MPIADKLGVVALTAAVLSGARAGVAKAAPTQQSALSVSAKASEANTKAKLKKQAAATQLAAVKGRATGREAVAETKKATAVADAARKRKAGEAKTADANADADPKAAE